MDSGSKTGLWTAIPYASMWACSIVFSLTSDYLIRKKILSTATVRKIFNTISHLGPALCLLVIVIFVTNEKPQINLTLVRIVFLPTQPIHILHRECSPWAWHRWEHSTQGSSQTLRTLLLILLVIKS